MFCRYRETLVSYPKQSADLRSIIINNTKYHWRFSPGGTQSTLVVYGPVSGRQSLSVALLERRDQWLVFPESTDNQPKTIGPSFVRKAIEFGLSSGWEPEKVGQTIQIQWKSGQFAAT